MRRLISTKEDETWTLTCRDWCGGGRGSSGLSRLPLKERNQLELPSLVTRSPLRSRFRTASSSPEDGQDVGLAEVGVVQGYVCPLCSPNCGA